jgi:ATP-binding cassette subfamily B protein
MKEVLGKYKPYVPMMLLVVMFLFGQAMSELMLPSYMSDIINNGVVKGDIPYIYSLGLRMVLVSFLAVACAITGNLIAARVAAGSARDIRSSLFRRVMTYSAKEYS